MMLYEVMSIDSAPVVVTIIRGDLIDSATPTVDVFAVSAILDAWSNVTPSRRRWAFSDDSSPRRTILLSEWGVFDGGMRLNLSRWDSMQGSDYEPIDRWALAKCPLFLTMKPSGEAPEAPVDMGE